MLETRKPVANEEANLLALDEDHFLDLKSSLSKPAKLQQFFVSFANTDGGELYIGIEDKKFTGERIAGYATHEAANSMVDTLLHQTTPEVEGVDAEFIDFGSRGLVLHLTIPKSEKVHYTSDDECYKRLNAATIRLKKEAITQLQYSKGQISFERTPALGCEIGDLLSSDYFPEYLTKIQAKLTPSIFLQKQKLVIHDYGVERPAIAAVLLFADEPQALMHTRCAIKLYRLRTSSDEYKREQLVDQPVTIEGPLELQIKRVLEWGKAVLHGANYRANGHLVSLEYPVDALKEVLVNAVIHRDYSLNDDIHIRVYDNRVEVQSPGRLPGYITTKNILKERFARNPAVVRLLHKLPDPPNKDIGEGLDTVFNKMHEAGLVAPTIEERDNCVVVTLKHQRLASLEDLIDEFLDTHDFVTNRDVRELSGQASENRVKSALQRLRKMNKIEPLDPNARPFEFKYRRVKSLPTHSSIVSSPKE
jgi:ATP-dependent DNA helicase RecG